MRKNKKNSEVNTVKDAFLQLIAHGYKIFYIDDNKNVFACRGILKE